MPNHLGFDLEIIKIFWEIKKSFIISEPEESDSGSDSDSEMDLDLTVDFMALSTDAQADINAVGKSYNLGKSDFVRFLARDIEEVQELRNVKQQEEEKAMFSVWSSPL